MSIDNSFIRFTAICGFLTVFTTLGVHLGFPDPPPDFEVRVQLFQNSTYLFQRWFIIGHCLLALIAAWGFFLVQYRKALGWAGLGFLFLTVFAVVEIARQLFVLFYLNGLRASYVAEMDVSTKALFKHDLIAYSLFSGSFFGLFILAFGVGNLCYGLSLWKQRGLGKILSVLFIAWSLGSFMALGNEFWRNTQIGVFIHNYNFVFQPLMRGLLAWWVWNIPKTTVS